MLLEYFVVMYNLKKKKSWTRCVMRMNLQDIYQERELVLVVIKVGLILLEIKLRLIFFGIKLGLTS